jgi:hypothetical protein
MAQTGRWGSRSYPQFVCTGGGGTSSSGVAVNRGMPPRWLVVFSCHGLTSCYFLSLSVSCPGSGGCDLDWRCFFRIARYLWSAISSTMPNPITRISKLARIVRTITTHIGMTLCVVYSLDVSRWGGGPNKGQVEAPPIGVTSRRDYPTSTPVTMIHAIIVVSFRIGCFSQEAPPPRRGNSGMRPSWFPQTRTGPRSGDQWAGPVDRTAESCQNPRRGAFSPWRYGAPGSSPHAEKHAHATTELGNATTTGPANIQPEYANVRCGGVV